MPSAPRSNLTISMRLFCDAIKSGVTPSFVYLFTLIPSAPRSDLFDQMLEGKVNSVIYFCMFGMFGMFRDTLAKETGRLSAR